MQCGKPPKSDYCNLTVQIEASQTYTRTHIHTQVYSIAYPQDTEGIVTLDFMFAWFNDTCHLQHFERLHLHATSNSLEEKVVFYLNR